MFKDATLGLFATPLGVASRCVECRANSGDDPIACNGFGPGCLVMPRRVERLRRDEETESPAAPSR
jgi:hypothetical protein